MLLAPKTLAGTLAIAALWTTAAPAAAQFNPPPPQMPVYERVTYHTREEPTDPQSAIIWTIRLDLQNIDHDSNGIGWRINRVELTKAGDPNDYVWAENDPEIGTPDGLWWVDHADLSDPIASEFAETPLLEGTASVVSGADAELIYSFQGAVYTGEPVFGGDESSMSYNFNPQGLTPPRTPPQDEDEDEPTQVIEDERT